MRVGKNISGSKLREIHVSNHHEKQSYAVFCWWKQGRDPRHLIFLLQRRAQLKLTSALMLKARDMNMLW